MNVQIKYFRGKIRPEFFEEMVVTLRKDYSQSIENIRLLTGISQSKINEMLLGKDIYTVKNTLAYRQAKNENLQAAINFLEQLQAESEEITASEQLQKRKWKWAKNILELLGWFILGITIVGLQSAF